MREYSDREWDIKAYPIDEAKAKIDSECVSEGDEGSWSVHPHTNDVGVGVHWEEGQW